MKKVWRVPCYSRPLSRVEDEVRMGNGDRRETSFFAGNENGPAAHGGESGSITGEVLLLIEIFNLDHRKNLNTNVIVLVDVKQVVFHLLPVR